MANGTVSIDIQQIEDILGQMDVSRKSMYNAICELNVIRQSLATGDVWAGAGAKASLESFERVLTGILTEQKRINALTYTIKEYSAELQANEAQTAQAAGRQ